jgi:hypothetical protein
MAVVQGLVFKSQVSMETLLIELGLSTQPLQESFVTFGKWVTNTWLKSIWEKVDRFNIKIEIAPLPIQPPQVGDRWFMKSVMELGTVTNPEELRIINRVCCYQQVLFILDILDAGGNSLDRKYLKQRPEENPWSTLIFPIEKLTQGQFRIWEQLLLTITPRGRYGQRLGRFLNKGHKIWEWRIDEDSRLLFHIKGQTMDIYTPSTPAPETNHHTTWIRWRVEVP